MTKSVIMTFRSEIPGMIVLFRETVFMVYLIV